MTERSGEKVTRVTIPLRYGLDWFTRCAGYEDYAAAEVKRTARTITFDLDAEALADLTSDAKHYTSPMMRREFIAEGSGGIVRSADTALRVLSSLPSAQGKRS